MAGFYHTGARTGSGLSFAHDFTLLQAGLESLTTALLLGILYTRVRSTERDTLRLVWGCTVAVALVPMVFNLGAYSTYSLDGEFDIIWFSPLVALFTLPVLLWFARRASRLSLAHAFFLMFVTGGVTLPYLEYLVDASPYAGLLLDLIGGILAVWLLANFDVRGLRFRRVSAGLVIALESMIYLPLVVLGAVGIYLAVPLLAASVVLPLILVYLLRVRQPESGGRVQ